MEMMDFNELDASGGTYRYFKPADYAGKLLVVFPHAAEIRENEYQGHKSDRLEVDAAVCVIDDPDAVAKEGALPTPIKVRFVNTVLSKVAEAAIGKGFIATIRKPDNKRYWAFDSANAETIKVLGPLCQDDKLPVGCKPGEEVDTPAAFDLNDASNPPF